MTTFHSEPNMHYNADIQHLQRQSICSCWTWTMEQSFIIPERGQTYRTTDSGGHFCLDSGAMVPCELFKLCHLEITLLT